MDTYDFLVLPFVEIEIRLGTIGKSRFDSSVDKKYFEKIKETLESGDWNLVINKNTVEYISSKKIVSVDDLNLSNLNLNNVSFKQSSLKLITDVTTNSKNDNMIN